MKPETKILRSKLKLWNERYIGFRLKCNSPDITPNAMYYTIMRFDRFSYEPSNLGFVDLILRLDSQHEPGLFQTEAAFEVGRTGRHTFRLEDVDRLLEIGKHYYRDNLGEETWALLEPDECPNSVKPCDTQ